MRYAFIVNPVAGQGGHDNGIVRNIRELVLEHKDEDIGIYKSTRPKDAGEIAESLAYEAMKAGDDIVVFACGGDGTSHEVANGIYGYDNAVMGIVPIGSGNDLVRELSRERGNYRDYFDVNKQLLGIEKEIDVMELSWEAEGQTQKRIGVNNINIGFDGNTAVRASELKEKPLISGSFAYIVAVFSTLVKKEGQSLHITADGEEFYNGDLLLSTIGNGGYCGGGIRSCPYAMLDDGQMELMAIQDMPRRKFVKLFPKYRAGRIFETEKIEDYITYRRAENITITPLLAETMKFVSDGEVFETGTLNVKICPKALRLWELK